MTPKQQRFIEEYLVDLNATEAAKRAGYSEKTAYSQGQRLLKNAEVAAQISEAQQERGEKTGVTAERVLEELGSIGFSDIRHCFTRSGHLKRPEEWPDEVAAAISSVEVVTRPGAELDEDGRREIEYVHKLRLWDKNSALEKIAKHLGMFVERHEHTGKGGGPMDFTFDLDSARREEP